MKMSVTFGNLTTAGTQSIAYDASKGDMEACILHVFSMTDIAEQTHDCGIMTACYDGTTLVSTFGYSFGGSGSTGGQRGYQSGAIYMDSDAPTTLFDGALSIDTANDEVDLDFSGGTSPAAAYEYILIGFHGSDVNAAAVLHDGTDQTEAPGFDWNLVLAFGPSTSSSTTTNAANQFGACDKSGNQANIRHGHWDGTTTSWAIFTDNVIARNAFNASALETLTIDAITTNGFDLSVSSGDEPGIYLCLGFDNSVEVIESTTITAATGTQAITTTHEPEYLLVGGNVDGGATNTMYTNTSGANMMLGVADLEAGVGASGEYAAWRISKDRGSGINDGICEISHTYLVFGFDSDTGREDVEADVSAVSSTSLTIDKDLADNDALIFIVNIGAEPAGGAKALAGVVQAVATTVGTLTGPKSLEGVVQAAANTIAELGRETFLNGVAEAAASTVGSLGRETYLAGVVQGVATVLADTLAASGQIEGVIQAAANVIGDLTRQAPLEGLSTGQATTVGDLTVIRPLAGTASGAASTVGSLTKGRLLEGRSTGQATTVGSLGRTAPLEGVSQGIATVAGVITRSINLSPAPVQAGATVIGALTQTTPEETARTDDSYEVLSKLQGPQKWGPQNPPRVYTFFEEYKLKGTEGNGTVVRLVVLPPHAQVVNLALSHDNLGTHLLQIGNQNDEDCYAADQDVSSGGVIVPSTYAVAARPMREAQIIQVKFTGAGAINPGGIIRIHGVSVQPMHRIRGEQEHT